MTTRIFIDQDASNTASMLAEGTAKILDALAFAKRVKGILDSTVSGNPQDNAALVAAGVGANNTEADNAWAIFSNAYDAINVAAIAELSRLDQG